MVSNLFRQRTRPSSDHSQEVRIGINPFSLVSVSETAFVRSLKHIPIVGWVRAVLWALDLTLMLFGAL